MGSQATAVGGGSRDDGGRLRRRRSRRFGLVEHILPNRHTALDMPAPRSTTRPATLPLPERNVNPPQTPDLTTWLNIES